MPTISINGKSHQVPAGITIIQACEIAGIEIPRFCYHERLAIAGNCRMCLVEVAGGPPKPVASCAMPVADNMQIFTDTPMVKKAREGVMEFMLANHPLDCPICDQAGECDLQDQAYQYGKGKSDFSEHKRAVPDKNMGELVKTNMTRCIHCTRCVRFIEDVAGTCELGAVSRGEDMQITTYLEKNITSELSGNVIDLCPVGALTSKPYAFKARSWELKKCETIDVMDAVGCNIRIDYRGLEVLRILPRLNEEINEEWISDKTRFCYDGLKYQRLDKPYIKKIDRFEAASFQEAFAAITEKFLEIKPSEVACLSGQLSSVQEIFALKNLMQKLGSNHFDCRLNSEKFNGKNRGEFLFNSTIAGIQKADACLLIGVNPRKDAPVLNAALRKKWLKKDLKIAAIGTDKNLDLTYKYEHLGDNFATLMAIANNSHPFCEILKSAKNPMLVFGTDAVSGENGEAVIAAAKAIATRFNMLRSDWMGFNFLAKNSGLINGLELGFVSSSSAQEIVSLTKKGEVKMLILHGVDEGIDFEALKETFVIYIGSHGDAGAKAANVILPACAYSEKEAIFVNLEGRPQTTKKAVFGPGQAKNDVELIIELAHKLNDDFAFKNQNDLHLALAKQFPHLTDLDSILAVDPKSLNHLEAEILSLQTQNGEQKIENRDYNFYLTNAIARASRTLNRC